MMENLLYQILQEGFVEFVDLDRIIKLDLTRWQRNQLPKLPSKTFFPCTEEKFVIKRMKKVAAVFEKIIKYQIRNKYSSI